MRTRRLVESEVRPDTPLQRVVEQQEEELVSSHRTYSVYLEACFEPMTFKGRPIVSRYDPETWPYAPEVEYEKDWNEEGE